MTSTGTSSGARTGAEAMILALAQGGVEVCFANPGTTEMWLVGALDKTPSIRPVLGLHETVCAGAADGYGRMKRKPACTGLAATVSSWVHTSQLPGAMKSDVLEALRATRRSHLNDPSTSKGRVSTLIVPHDRTWQKPTGILADLQEDEHHLQEDRHQGGDGGGGESLSGRQQTTAVTDAIDGDIIDRDNEIRDFISRCAAALVACAPGKAALYCGGEALIAERGALQAAGAIAELAGATLLCENAFPRLDRGGGLPHPTRLPYFPQDAARALGAFELVVTADARRPIAMFGYDGAGPSHLLRLDDSNIWEIDSGTDIPETMKMLQQEVEKLVGRTAAVASSSVAPPRDIPPPRAPADGKLTASTMCAVIAAVQPENAIVVDESLTSGGSYWDQSVGCPKFSHLTLTGGAIGFGPPAAVGAAVACPASRVINIQADGSGLYAPQALWTQARERLDVVTVVCSNRAYAILKLELAMQRVGAPGLATRRLTDLSDPPMRWTSLAEGFGVHAVAVDTTQGLRDALIEAFDRSGPTLIEAMLQ